MDAGHIERTLASIRSSFEARAFSLSRPPETPAGGEAGQLRLALAVREWASPIELLKVQSESSSIDEILDDVAPDVLADADAMPGRWYLGLDARARALEQAEPQTLLDQIAGPGVRTDEGDPVLWAFRAIFGLEAPDLDALNLDQLRSLANAARWLAPTAPEARKLNDQVAALLAQRARKGDLERLSGVELIGRDKELSQLLDFALDTRTEERCAYLYGIGGSGKSTVLRHFEHRLASAGDPPSLLLFDLDRVDLNPADPHTLELDLVRQLSAFHPEDSERLQQGIGDLLSVRAARRADAPSSTKMSRSIASPEEESMTFQGLAEEASALTPLMIDEALGRARYLLIVDTIEVAASKGPAVMRMLGSWLGRLAMLGVKLVLSGRDPPSQLLTEHLLKPIGKARVIPLGQLEAEGSARLLRSAGLEDEELVQMASQVLPGNPLFLTLAAMLYRDRSAAEKGKAILATGRIDPVAARRYLDERLVRHLPAKAAQPYLLAALLLPRVDLPLLAAVVVPAVDKGRVPSRSEAARLLAGLGASEWLATLSADGKALDWSAELRNFALRLLDVDPAALPMAGTLRLLALVHHGRRKSQDDRVMAAYHRLTRGDAPEPVLAALRSPAAIGRLTEFIEDLPRNARLALTERLALDRASPRAELPGQPAEAALSSPARPDSDWRAFLEGLGSKPGEGLRLVKRGHSEQALKMYRKRPTRPRGVPPLFVIQALAEQADWHWSRDDPAAIDGNGLLDQIGHSLVKSGRLPSEEFGRLYWFTRLTLMREQRLTPYHRELLSQATARLSFFASSAIAGLMAVADALEPNRPPLVPERSLHSRGGLTDPRMLLASVYRGDRLRTQVRLDAIVVMQPRWERYLSRWLEPTRGHGETLATLANGLQSLDGAPYSHVAQFLRAMRRPVPANLMSRDREIDAIILRGLTVEFHRPIVAAMKRRSRVELAPLLHEVTSQMGIRPREMNVIEALVAEKPDVWLPAFVTYSDRCRLLPLLCERLHGHFKEPVCRAFLEWDEGLSRHTGGSDWRRVQVEFG